MWRRVLSKVPNLPSAPEGMLNGQQAIKVMLCASFPNHYHNVIRKFILGQNPRLLRLESGKWISWKAENLGAES